MAPANSLGRTVEELLGSRLFDLIPNRLASFGKDSLDKVIMSGKPVLFKEERQGTMFENHVYPIFGSEGEIKWLALRLNR